MPDRGAFKVRKAPLRDQIYQVLLERLAGGELVPGVRLKDTAVAADLGVSRTPVREALLRLEREGFLAADHHRGFSVRGFDAHEIREVYPLVWALEGLALREGGAPADLGALERLNRAMRARGLAPLERARLDEQWHAALVGSSNRRLAALLAPLKSSVRRYEQAYMRSSRDVAASAAEHDGIAAAVRTGDRALAARRLEEHWRRGMESLLGAPPASKET